jgi:hypothetical protein
MAWHRDTVCPLYNFAYILHEEQRMKQTTVPVVGHYETLLLILAVAQLRYRSFPFLYNLSGRLSVFSLPFSPSPEAKLFNMVIFRQCWKVPWYQIKSLAWLWCPMLSDWEYIEYITAVLALPSMNGWNAMNPNSGKTRPPESFSPRNGLLIGFLQGL